MVLPLAVMACDPIPVSPEEAERLCRAEVREADGISGNVGVGVGSGGGVVRGDIKITNRILNPQTEEEFLAECIARRVEGRPAPTTFGITAGGRS